MTLGAAMTSAAESVTAAEAGIAASAGDMADAARNNDAGGVAEAIPGLTSGVATLKLCMGQLQMMSGAAVDAGKTAGQAGG